MRSFFRSVAVVIVGFVLVGAQYDNHTLRYDETGPPIGQPIDGDTLYEIRTYTFCVFTPEQLVRPVYLYRAPEGSCDSAGLTEETHRELVMSVYYRDRWWTTTLEAKD